MNALAAIVLVTAGVAGPAEASDPFRTAAIVPSGVRLYLHIDGAAAIRAEIADRPIARWMQTMLASGQSHDAWEALANAAGVDGARLFDTCLGRRLTLLVRGHDKSAQWTALSEVDPEETATLLDRLAPRVLAPKHKLAILHLPEHDLLLARSGRLLLIGPRPRPGLFYEMVKNLTMPPKESLADNPAIGEARQLGPGSVGVFMRHEPPMGGWSVAVADLRGHQIKIHYAARFDHSPFTGEVTQVQWDLAPLRSLEDSTILVFIEPTDGGGGWLDAFVAAGLGEAAMTAEMRANLGSRQITTIADFDGRLEHPPFGLMLPTVARIYEVKDADRAWQQWDQQMIRLVEKFRLIAPGEDPVEVPDPATFEPGEPRRVDVGPLAKWLFGNLPGIDRVSLNWTVVGGHQAQWCIIASNPEHLTVVAKALTSESKGEPNIGQRANCGTADGRRLAEHLRSWRDQAALLAAPEDVEAFRHTVQMFSELSDGIERCRWQVCRPSTDRMRLEAQIILSPPDSSR